MSKTVVLGASPNPARVSYEATLRLQRRGEEVIAIGRREGQIGTVAIETGAGPVADVDTVTLYLSAKNQTDYEAYILDQLQPKRLIFNPGAENPRLYHAARERGIDAMNACTLVMLSVGQY